MIKGIVGSAGSGKTVLIKKEIIKEIEQNAKPIIYINFGKSSNNFSNLFKAGSLIVNANSFTQISKIKDKEYNDLIFIDRTYNSGVISNKIKTKLLIEIFNNKNWKNHIIFIDEVFNLDDKDKDIIVEFSKNREIVITLQSLDSNRGFPVEEYTYLKNRINKQYTEKRIDKFLNTKNINEIRYVKELKENNEFGIIEYAPTYNEDPEIYLREIEHILRRA